MAISAPRWPTKPLTVFFDDVASRTTLSKAVSGERLRRVAPRIYTADLTSDLPKIVRNNWSLLCGHLLPGAVIVDRSAATSAIITDNILTVAADTTRTSIKLPGLEIRIRPGAASDPDLPWSDLPWSHGLLMSSPARTLLDNLGTSRSRNGRPSRTLSLAELEDWVATKYIIWGPERTDRLRVQARDLAETTGRTHHIETINALFEQLLGLEPVRPKASEFFKAVTAKQAWDERRLQLFAQAIDALSQLYPPSVPDRLPESDPPGELPFYESYFSNYIEGTIFSVDEARDLVETNTPPAERPADGHDILGTYRCVVDPIDRKTTSTDPIKLIDHLIARHEKIMHGRPEKNPGIWKSKNNRVGGYGFVDKNLVEGTLLKSFERIKELPGGLARALYVMLVITEVHPFEDGNGRVARIMMNAELSAAKASRIVIPNVYRDEYISGLRRTSTSDGDLTAYIRIMTYAWRWTAAMPWNDRIATEGQLHATNAFLDSTDAGFRGKRLKLP